MKALNPSIPQGIPVAGVYGALAHGWGVPAEQVEEFVLTPGNTPDEVACDNCAEAGEPGTVPEEVTDDGRPEPAGDEVA